MNPIFDFVLKLTYVYRLLHLLNLMYHFKIEYIIHAGAWVWSGRLPNHKTCLSNDAYVINIVANIPLVSIQFSSILRAFTVNVYCNMVIGINSKF